MLVGDLWDAATFSPAGDDGFGFTNQASRNPNTAQSEGMRAGCFIVGGMNDVRLVKPL
jgi:hypothetical protein